MDTPHRPQVDSCVPNAEARWRNNGAIHGIAERPVAFGACIFAAHPGVRPAGVWNLRTTFGVCRMGLIRWNKSGFVLDW